MTNVNSGSIVLEGAPKVRLIRRIVVAIGGRMTVQSDVSALLRREHRGAQTPAERPQSTQDALASNPWADGP